MLRARDRGDVEAGGRTKARAIWPGVQPLAWASWSTTSTMAMLAARLSPWNRGLIAAEVRVVEVVERAQGPGQETHARAGCRGRSRCRARAASAGSRARGRATTRSTRSAAPKSGARRAHAGWWRAPPRTVRGSAPCPASRVRPWRRPSLRSACRGRPGAGSRGRCDRRRGGVSDPSQAARTYSGRPLMPRLDGSSGSRTMPNLVAITASSRRPDNALPTSISLVCGPYMSEVSKKVTPSSRARWIVAMDSSSFAPRRSPTSPCSPAPGATPRGPGFRAQSSPWGSSPLGRAAPLARGSPYGRVQGVQSDVLSLKDGRFRIQICMCVAVRDSRPNATYGFGRRTRRWEIRPRLEPLCNTNRFGKP